MSSGEVTGDPVDESNVALGGGCKCDGVGVVYSSVVSLQVKCMFTVYVHSYSSCKRFTV